MLPSPVDLSYFVEVASTLNVSRAAERIGISQPSVTLAIQRLEDVVGAPLFIRSKKGVSLTQAGKQLLAHARELQQRWESIRTQALASSQNIQGRYTLGAHTSVALYSLKGFVADLLEAHPRLELKLMHDLSRKITERVIQMEVDIGIVVNPVKHPDLVIRPLCEDEVTLWVGEGNRSIQDPRSGKGVLICDPELIQSQDLMKKLKRGGIGFQRVLASSSLEVITDLTANGAGIGIIPGRVAAVAGGRLRPVPRAPVFRDEICVLYRVENKSIKSVQEIVQRATAAFATK